MSKEILYILLPDFASHEMVYLMEAISSDETQLKPNPKYINKIVAPTMEPVTAIGGFRVIPDYSFESIPEDYAALILIGGYGWLTPISTEVIPIVRKALDNSKIVGSFSLIALRQSFSLDELTREFLGSGSLSLPRLGLQA